MELVVIGIVLLAFLMLIVWILDHIWIILLIVGSIVFIVVVFKIVEYVMKKREDYARYGSKEAGVVTGRTNKRREGQRKKRIAKEKCLLKRVEELGKLAPALNKINQEVVFLEAEQTITANCGSLLMYQNFSVKEYFFTHFKECKEKFEELRANVAENNIKYRRYKEKFLACGDFTSKEEIKRIPKRGMTVDKFKELERQLFSKKLVPAPHEEIVFNFIIRYQNKEKRIKISGDETQKLLKEVADEKDYILVCEKSFLHKELLQLNAKYVFKNIKIPIFNVQCNSYNQYEKFSIKRYLFQKGTEELEELQLLCEGAKQNAEIYNEYMQEYVDLSKYLRTEQEILGVQVSLSVKKFQNIEQKMYAQMLCEEPICDFVISIKVEYRSPAGRNYYKKEEKLTKDLLEVFLEEIRNEQADLRQIEERREILRLAREKERKELREQREIERQRREEERAREQYEVRRRKEFERQAKVREEAAIRALLKKKLEEREAEVLKREQEFQNATKGHIYATADSFATIEVKKNNLEIGEEPLSTWEKMKQLKKTYENGEITYEEYNEKRKHLL